SPLPSATCLYASLSIESHGLFRWSPWLGPSGKRRGNGPGTAAIFMAFALALRHPFLYKRGLIGIVARFPSASAYRAMPPQHPLEDPLWLFPDEKLRPRAVACAARRMR